MTRLHGLQLNSETRRKHGVFDAFSGHRQLAKILLVDVIGLGRAFDQKLLTARGRVGLVIQRYLDAAVADGQIPPLDAELAAAVWLGAINEVVVRWLHTGRPHCLDAARPALRRLLLNGIGLDGVGLDGARMAAFASSQATPTEQGTR